MESSKSTDKNSLTGVVILLGSELVSRSCLPLSPLVSPKLKLKKEKVTRQNPPWPCLEVYMTFIYFIDQLAISALDSTSSISGYSLIGNQLSVQLICSTVYLQFFYRVNLFFPHFTF